jgi:hypothetical protein
MPSRAQHLVLRYQEHSMLSSFQWGNQKIFPKMLCPVVLRHWDLLGLHLYSLHKLWFYRYSDLVNRAVHSLHIWTVLYTFLFGKKLLLNGLWKWSSACFGSYWWYSKCPDNEKVLVFETLQCDRHIPRVYIMRVMLWGHRRKNVSKKHWKDNLRSYLIMIFSWKSWNEWGAERKITIMRSSLFLRGMEENMCKSGLARFTHLERKKCSQASLLIKPCCINF